MFSSTVADWPAVDIATAASAALAVAGGGGITVAGVGLVGVSSTDDVSGP